MKGCNITTGIERMHAGAMAGAGSQAVLQFTDSRLEAAMKNTPEESVRSGCGVMEMEEAVNRYVDGELPVAEQAALFAHLSTCASCRSLMESVLQFRRMSRLERIAVPPAAGGAFLQRLAAHKARRPLDDRPVRRASRRPQRAAGVAAVGVLLLAGLWLANQSAPPLAPLLVTSETERVEMAPQHPAASADSPPARKALYVFYPGLLVEAEREAEPLSSGAL